MIPIHIKNAFVSWLVFSCTVIGVGIGYATLSSWLSSSDLVTSTNTVSSSSWNKIVNSIMELDDRTSYSWSSTTNGYQKLPGWLILQWWYAASCGSSCWKTVTFPIAFTNQAFSVSTTQVDGSTPCASQVSGLSKTGFSIDSAASQWSKPSVYWMAVGN